MRWDERRGRGGRGDEEIGEGVFVQASSAMGPPSSSGVGYKPARWGVVSDFLRATGSEPVSTAEETPASQYGGLSAKRRRWPKPAVAAAAAAAAVAAAGRCAAAGAVEERVTVGDEGEVGEAPCTVRAREREAAGRAPLEASLACAAAGCAPEEMPRAGMSRKAGTLSPTASQLLSMRGRPLPVLMAVDSFRAWATAGDRLVLRACHGGINSQGKRIRKGVMAAHVCSDINMAVVHGLARRQQTVLAAPFRTTGAAPPFTLHLTYAIWARIDHHT